MAWTLYHACFRPRTIQGRKVARQKQKATPTLAPVAALTGEQAMPPLT